MSDTSPEMAARYRAMLMALTPERRLEMVGDMWDMATELHATAPAATGPAVYATGRGRRRSPIAPEGSRMSATAIVRTLGPVALAAALACGACSSGSGPDSSPAPGPSADPVAPPVDAPVDASVDPAAPVDPTPIDVTDRPAALLSLLGDGDLKTALSSCDASSATRTRFSIAHRGAPLRLPEHSREGYLAAVGQGAGIVECDMTFTSDAEPVCRHSQCDLHATIDILVTDLAASCSVPPDLDSDAPFADVRCCASDLTLAEFSTLRAKRDGADPEAATLDAYLAGTPGWTGDPAADYGTVVTLPESIALLEPLGVAMTPELKAFEPPAGDDERFSREALSRAMFDAFRAANVEPDRLYPQSFELDDVRLWNRTEPAYAERAVWLDGRYRTQEIDAADASNLTPGFDELAGEGVGYLAPPIWMLLTLDEAGEMVPSDYAVRARAAGLPLLTWSLERDADAPGGGFYFRSVAGAYQDEGDQLRALDVLANDVGAEGVFSDWPATTS